MKKIVTIVSVLLAAMHGFSQQTFTNFQNASMVIGQLNFQSQTTGRNNYITYGPSYSAISSKGMLAVAEQTGGSVKIWYTLPATNGQPADVEVGNPNFTTGNNGPTQAYAANFDGVAWSPDGNKLIAACGSQNRVLIWNSIPATNGQPADVVLGQTNFTSSGSGTSSTRLYYPCGVMVSPDGKLLVAEYYNNRVLVWNSIPTTNGAPANVVIGQSTFTTNTISNQANGANRPWGVNFSPDGKLLIANSGSNQIFIYDSIPVSNGESATMVIGHNQFGLGSSGCSDSTMYIPVAATVTPDGKVAVAEFGNHRALIYDSVPSGNGAHADIVLGQSSFTTNIPFAPSGTPDTNNLQYIYNVSTDLNGRFFVAGRDMHRVMVFGNLPVDSADLGITITESTSALCDSSNVVYRITINNPGPDTAKNVIATSTFPEGYSIDFVTVLDGTYNEASGYWNIPAIEPGDSAVLYINGLVDAGMSGQTITTYSNILNSSAIDTNLNNNGTSVSVTIMGITKPANPLANDTETCYGTSASLSASGSGVLYWYAGADDIIPLDTGTVYNTVPLTSNSTFYVEANNGCPSSGRTPVDVSVNPVYNLSESVSVCSGDSYTFPDGTTQNNITSTVVHSSNLLTVPGCDSIIVTTVTVNPVYNLSESASVCSGDSYTFPDGTTQNNITSTVVHSSNLLTVPGCDSIIVTTVTVNPVYNLSESASVCSGNSYTFPDGTTILNISSDTIQTSYLLSKEGCDSIIVTSLTVNPVYDINESVTVCKGDSYTFPDGTIIDNITSPVFHESHLTSILGCDSIITTDVEVTVVNVTVIQDGTLLTAASAGLEYQWVDCNDQYSTINGETNQTFAVTESGNYSVIITDNGCADTSDCYSVVIETTELFSTNDITIYPNPTRDYFTIDLIQDYDQIDIEILDMQGQFIRSYSYSGSQCSIEIDLSSCLKGLYFIRMTIDNKLMMFRVVKE
jgi:hypothetical protein